LEVIFETPTGTGNVSIVSSYVSSAVYETARLEGYTVPANCSRIRYRLLRENTGSGGVGARRPSLNFGASLAGWSPVRGDVERGANNVTRTAQLTDDAGLGQTADWDNVTGLDKPEDGATKNTGNLANLDQVDTNQIRLDAVNDITDANTDDGSFNLSPSNINHQFHTISVNAGNNGAWIQGRIRIQHAGGSGEPTRPFALQIRHDGGGEIATLIIPASGTLRRYSFNILDVNVRNRMQRYRLQANYFGTASEYRFRDATLVGWAAKR
jgi:hypothetical protein